MKQVAIGIDLGGTSTAVGLVDQSGHVLIDDDFVTKDFQDFRDFINKLHEVIDKLYNQVKENQEIELCGIGIGAPNGNYYRGSIEFAPNLPWKGILMFVEELKKFYNIPIVLTNDANAAAIGEMIYGGAKGMKDFIVITLGTGLGSGIVANGKLIYGADGFAGELGHTIIRHNGRFCGCGLQGCLETYVSATGLKRTVFHMLARFSYPSDLRDKTFNEITSKMVAEAAQQGDKIAIESFEYTAKILGQKLAEAVAYTSPEAIFLFGGLAQAGDILFVPTKKYMEDNLLRIFKNKVKILPSGIPDQYAAVLGASALVWAEIERLKQ